jgi:acyl-CoA synthetase (NDP forming)
MDREDTLDKIFNAATVAIVGASQSPAKMGNWCVRSLLDSGYPGGIFPINPNRREILGLKAYPSLRELPGNVDLAIIVVPAAQVLASLEECAQQGARAAVIITSGFKEIEDPSGAILQQELVQLAREKGIRIIGPNTFGMVHTHARLNASFTPPLCHLRGGSVSMVGQSGGVLHLALFPAIQEGVGLNKVVGLGNRCDMDFPELVDYLARDPETRAIALYVEGVEDPGSLLRQARKVIPTKPIIAMKGGKTEAIRKAAAAHTGAIAGNFEMYEAAFRQSGIITVQDPLELLDVAKALAILGPPKGERVAVLSIQAGPGILMTDMCVERGLTLASFVPKTLAQLQFPGMNMTIRTNPVDMGYALTPDLFQQTVRAVLLDPNVDALVVGIIDPSDRFRDYFSEELLRLAQEKQKPILVSYVTAIWEQAKKVWEALEGKGLLFFPEPARAVNALAGMIRYGRVLKALKGRAHAAD